MPCQIGVWRGIFACSDRAETVRATTTRREFINLRRTPYSYQVVSFRTWPPPSLRSHTEKGGRTMESLLFKAIWYPVAGVIIIHLLWEVAKMVVAAF